MIREVLPARPEEFCGERESAGVAGYSFRPGRAELYRYTDIPSDGFDPRLSRATVSIIPCHVGVQRHVETRTTKRGGNSRRRKHGFR